MILNPFQIRNLYRRLKLKISLEERIWLANFRGDFETYEERLLQLAKKYDESIIKNKD